MGNSSSLNAHILNITGLVQGVGFRPFVYHLAHQHHLLGWVRNHTQGVDIKIQGEPQDIDHFIHDLRAQAPEVSQILAIHQSASEPEILQSFHIVPSDETAANPTLVSPDLAPCAACQEDMLLQPRRLDYPFINCTHCGPRFSIIADLPYDRGATSMKSFTMCPECQTEYDDVHSRRFHAQPNACSICGPSYELHMEDKVLTDLNRIMAEIVFLLYKGQTVAIKGLGGYFLMCDAQNPKAVNQLRRRKNRRQKPFAVMFPNLDTLRLFTHISAAEEDLITSWKRPIVLLKTKRNLADQVSNGFPTMGAMLPYMPFHHLLFKHCPLPALVMTSGNLSEEPILMENTLAKTKLSLIADAVLTYNRDIINRVDDSVTMVVRNQPRIIRRSRGYVPAPIHLNFETQGIFGAGAELTHCFALGMDHRAVLSQHIGDLKNLGTMEFFNQSYARFKQLFRFEPSLIVKDLHPDYQSSQWADSQGVPTIAVQHHHAHIAACMAEHQLDEPVIGVALDGTGLGDDGHIWGGEFLICDLEKYVRHFHWDYLPLPGGDSAIKHPWKTAVACCYEAMGDRCLRLPLPIFMDQSREELEMLLHAIKHQLNSPLTSSTGRLFDAVSALLGLCAEADFHAEAPMRLEALCSTTHVAHYPYSVLPGSIDFRPMFRQIIMDLGHHVSAEQIANRFHRTIIDATKATIDVLAFRSGLTKIVLSGGVLQNRILLDALEKELPELGLTVYTHREVPSNDGGIALGQLAIGAKRRRLECV